MSISKMLFSQWIQKSITINLSSKTVENFAIVCIFNSVCLATKYCWPRATMKNFFEKKNRKNDWLWLLAVVVHTCDLISQLFSKDMKSVLNAKISKTALIIKKFVFNFHFSSFAIFLWVLTLRWFSKCQLRIMEKFADFHFHFLLCFAFNEK